MKTFPFQWGSLASSTINSGLPEWSLLHSVFSCPLSVPRLTLRWHYERDGVSNHERFDCLLNCLFRHRSKKTSKLRVTGLCEGNPPVTGGFLSQRASNAENVSIWWRHRDEEAVTVTPLSSQVASEDIVSITSSDELMISSHCGTAELLHPHKILGLGCNYLFMPWTRCYLTSVSQKVYQKG